MIIDTQQSGFFIGPLWEPKVKEVKKSDVLYYRLGHRGDLESFETIKKRNFRDCNLTNDWLKLTYILLFCDLHKICFKKFLVLDFLLFRARTHIMLLFSNKMKAMMFI